MSKFNKNAAVTAVGKTAPLRTTGVKTVTHEGGEGWETDDKTSLFRLAATNMVGESTFYESAGQRDNRFVELVHRVTEDDPEWMQRFIPYLRNNMFMRSASVACAVEYVVAGGPNGRQVINSAISRADELAEVLGYYVGKYGQRTKIVYPFSTVRIPAAIKRGLADAASRILNEYSAMKYDSSGKSLRVGDVIELTHPKPKDERTSALFKFLLSDRHRGRDARLDLELLPKVKAHKDLMALEVPKRREILSEADIAKVLADAGFTWEQLSGWLQGPMDADAWNAIIPNMGPMALMRNLRNFDEAKISKDAVDVVKNKLTDEQSLANAKLFPFRFWSAYKAAPSVRWGETLETGLNFACRNIPELNGRTLVVVDYSGSMSSTLNERSTVARWEIGALFGVAQFVKCERADLVAFGNNSYRIPLSSGTDLLTGMRVASEVYEANGGYYGTRSSHGGKYPGASNIGHGTETMKAILDNFKGHDRIVIFSDMQAFRGNTQAVLNLGVPIYSFDLAGHAAAHLPAGQKNTYLLAGFSDAAFTMMKVLEDGNHAGWPF